MTIYKIRNKKTGLYHRGGTYERWNKAGRAYDTIGKLRTMLTLNMNRNKRNVRFIAPSDFSEWEIVEYEETGTKSLHEIITPKRLFELLKN